VKQNKNETKGDMELQSSNVVSEKNQQIDMSEEIIIMHSE